MTTPAGASAVVTADHFTYQSPRLTRIAVSPSTALVMDGSTQPFAATAFDQFGAALASQPSFTWSSTGLGSVNASGLYQAPASGTGTATVTATSGGLSGSATVTIALASETWTGLGSTNNWSEPANWSANAVPSAGTTVLFSSVSVKNAVVDAAFAGAVATVQIYPGYSGTISLGRNLAVSGGFAENAGTYNANGFTTTVGAITTMLGGTFLASTATQTLTGGLVVSGGVFTGSTGTVTAGKLTLSAGTLNAPSGTLALTGGNLTVLSSGTASGTVISTAMGIVQLS